jgi:hypothetical protein
MLWRKFSIRFPQEDMRGREYDFGRFGALSEYQIFLKKEMVVVAIRLERICRDSKSHGSYKGMLRKINFCYFQEDPFLRIFSSKCRQ